MLNLKKFPAFAMPGLTIRSVMVEGRRALEITKDGTRTLWWPSPDHKWVFLGQEVMETVPEPVFMPMEPIPIGKEEMKNLFWEFDQEEAQTRNLRSNADAE